MREVTKLEAYVNLKKGKVLKRLVVKGRQLFEISVFINNSTAELQYSLRRNTLKDKGYSKFAMVQPATVSSKSGPSRASRGTSRMATGWTRGTTFPSLPMGNSTTDRIGLLPLSRLDVQFGQRLSSVSWMKHPFIPITASPVACSTERICLGMTLSARRCGLPSSFWIC